MIDASITKGGETVFIVVPLPPPFSSSPVPIFLLQTCSPGLCLHVILKVDSVYTYIITYCIFINVTRGSSFYVVRDMIALTRSPSFSLRAATALVREQEACDMTSSMSLASTPLSSTASSASSPASSTVGTSTSS